jgi:hypothetical protein
MPLTPKKVQKIKLRIHGNPIKLDATILSMTADGKKIRVSFDGPLEDMYLYKFNATELCNMDPENPGNIPGLFSEQAGFMRFEVL